MKKSNGWIVSKVFSFIKIIFFTVLGFLPSFLFIALFMQSGSPFSNYINFLSNPSSSWGAWLSAGIISIFGYFISVITSKKNSAKIIKNKPLLITLIFLFLAIFSLISVQLYLYANYTLRNDILVRLSADKENIFFTNNSMEEISFKMSVIMNPFCSVQCEYEFFDLSNGRKIDKGLFNITSIFSNSKNYEIENAWLVAGSQEIRRFEVSCKSQRTFLCYTSGRESKRAVIITSNYNLTEADRQFKSDSKERIISIWNSLSLTKSFLNQTLENIRLINGAIFTGDFSIGAENLFNELILFNSSFGETKKLWETQKFDLLKNELPISENKENIIYAEAEKLNSEILSNILAYNTLINDANSSRQLLTEISLMNVNSSLCSELSVLIDEFNNFTKEFEETKNLFNKTILSESISSNISYFYAQALNNPGNSTCLLTGTINQEDFVKINSSSLNVHFPEILFEEQASICCFLGKCEKCCENECSNENYPIIFLHGHNINKALPTDYSLDAFTQIKERLNQEGYIDAGAVILSPAEEQKGLWGKVNAPIIVTASYFFDIYRTEEGGEATISSSSDSIDTYAIRLKSIVDLVKARTNKDKVIIAAHSMGGVVTRRYLQIYGVKDVDKAILISAPNHGIDDKVRDYCGIIGPEKSCNDLDKNSILMNSLNNDATESVPIYNFIGIGCDMGTETGDGIVKNSSQYLETATNYYFSGKCNILNFDYFHESIILPDEHPEVYETIKEILEEN
jgi:hypothetical protein